MTEVRGRDDLRGIAPWAMMALLSPCSPMVRRPLSCGIGAASLTASVRAEAGRRRSLAEWLWRNASAPRTGYSAQARWHVITGAQLVPLVRAGARFENGVLVERSDAAA